MQKHLLYINLFAITSALALGACADEVENAVTPDMPEVGEKTPIELSVGGVDAPALTRAVITDGIGKTMQAFDVNTKIFMVMKSEKDPATHNGYEYSGDRTSPLYTVTRGEVAANSTDVIFYDNAETKTGNRVRYWDDAHARSSQLTIWAYAQKGESWNDCYFQEIINTEKTKLDDSYKKRFSTDTYYPWQSTEIYPAIREWNAMLGDNSYQTAQTLRCQDLLFSNNLSYNTEKSWADYRLKFDFTAHKFPRVNDVIEGTSTKMTEMKFYHAMSKITIQIKAGDGYKADGTDFILANSQSIDKLSGFNTKGLFNIKDGEFQMIHARTEITSIPKISESTGKTADPNYVLEALAIPNIHEFLKDHSSSDVGSRFVKDGTNVMIQFTIDGNTYKITSGALYDALKELTVGTGTNQIQRYTYNETTYIPMEAGKNYVFTFSIGKQKIDNISATLAEWINVTAAEQTPSNAYVKVSVKTDEGEYDTQVKGNPTFDLYRAAGTLYPGVATEEGYNGYKDYTWEKGYEKSTSLAETAVNTGIYTTEWFWPSNQTYYHFRTFSPKETPVTAGTSENGGNDYVSISGGTLIKVDDVDPTAKDYLWGAPFKTETTNPDAYSFTSGFCANETKANGNLYWAIGSTKDNITLIQHHMTSQVFVDLETSTDADAVDLSGATVELVNIATTARLNMGNGLITSFDGIVNVAMTPDRVAATTGTDAHPAYDYSYGVVAQPLSKTTGKIGVKITATDGNVYLINDLSAINEKSTTTAISEWLPGKKYYYKFKLLKTGITDLQATIVDWETVTAEDETVTIK